MRIGIDVGGTNVGIGIVNEDGNIVAETSFHTNKERQFNEIIEELIGKTRSLVEDSSMDLSDIKSVGLGLPGIIDPERGMFITAPNLRVSNFPIKEVLEREFKVPVFIDNDAKCAALAEAVFGATKEYDNSVTVTLGTGIGGGIIINKQIYRGAANSAGEIGHMVVFIDGEHCGCGRKGCWEQYASATALKRMAAKALKAHPNSIINKLIGWEPERLSGRVIFDAVKQGDQVAKHVLDEYTRNIAVGLINIINILSPEAIAVGGSISKQGDKLLSPVREYVEKSIISRNVNVPKIYAAQFGREAGIIGASILGR